MINNYWHALERCSIGFDVCAFSCPVFSALKNQAVTPSRLAKLIKLVGEDSIPMHPDVVETLYQCIDCRLCKEWCIYEDIDIPLMLQAARAHVIDHYQDIKLPPNVEHVKRNAEKNGMPFELPEHRAASKDSLLSLASSKGKVLYFSGCVTRNFQPEIAEATVQIFRNAGIEYVFMPDLEPCCGSAYRALGFTKLGTKAAKQTIDYIRNSGCRTIVTNCPRCAFTLQDVCDECDTHGEFKIIHTTTFIKQLYEESKIKYRNDLDEVVTFDDEPYMARYLGLLNEPREILIAIPGIKLNEPVPTMAQARPSTCYFGLPDNTISSEIIERRVEDFKRTKAKKIITASPFCKRDLSPLVSNEIEIEDIVEMVRTALE
jgi:Fe-S oxidoreductase